MHIVNNLIFLKENHEIFGDEKHRLLLHGLSKAKNGIISYDCDSLANRFGTLYPEYKDEIKKNIDVNEVYEQLESILRVEAT